MSDVIISDPTLTAFYEPPQPHESVYISPVIAPTGELVDLRPKSRAVDDRPAMLRVQPVDRVKDSRD